ncbi:MAG: cyclase family protein [Chloroflexi bacterium]|nr:cyclase family protein [Chloroflexota bacterium]
MAEELRWKAPSYQVNMKGKVIGYANKDPNNWGKWGEADQKGCANYITPAAIKAAGGLIKQGKVISCAMSIDGEAPSLRTPPLKFMTMTSADAILGDPKKAYFPGLQVNDDFLAMPIQGSTQWDGLAHFCWEDVMYNGFWGGDVGTAGLTHLGIHHLRESLVGRGVLLDIARYKGVDFLTPGTPVTDKDLDGCAKKQGVQVKAGDMLLVRTGHMGRWPKIPQPERMGFLRGGEPGMSITTPPWLHERQVTAVALDNGAAEVTPHEQKPALRPFPWHVQVIRNMGLLVGEFWALDNLAADCAKDGVYEFFLAAQPLNITNAVGTMLNPIAVK